MDLFTEDYLAHHGIKGQKWGVRRFQNPDGTMTAAGKARYGSADSDGGGSKLKAIAKGAIKDKLIRAETSAQHRINAARGGGKEIPTDKAITDDIARERRRKNAVDTISKVRGKDTTTRPKNEKETHQSSTKNNAVAKEVLKGVGKSVAANMLTKAASSGLGLLQLNALADGNAAVATGAAVASNILNTANFAYQVGNVVNTVSRAKKASS